MILRLILTVTLLYIPGAHGADITVNNEISCVSEESKKLGRRTEKDNDSNTRIVDWKMKESFSDAKSRILFAWKPQSDDRPKVTLKTTDKPHNSIAIRSRTKSSLIVVSSTSNFFSSESWTFVLNFNVETMIATRVVSNTAGVGSETIAYACTYEPAD